MRAPGAQAALAVLSLVANLLGYGFTLVMSHALPVARFGELSALVGVLVVACVAGTALQADLARRVASGADLSPARLLGDSVVVAVGVAIVVLLLSPVLWALLDIASWWSLWWLAAAMVPTTVAFGVQGLLQGEHRLARLGVLLALVQLAKFAAGLVAAAFGGSIPLAFALVAAFTTLAALAALPLAGVVRVARPTWTASSTGHWLRDVGAVLGVLVLTSLDLLLARGQLSADDSGLYAAGNVVTRAGFWGPLFVVLAAYPRLSDPATRRDALRRAVVSLGVIGALTVLGAWVGQGLLPLLLGDDYRPVAPIAWLFAVQGAALAAVQLGVYAGLAVHDRRPAVVLWAVALVEVGLVSAFWHDSVEQIITVVTCCSVALVVAIVALGVVGRGRRADGAPDTDLVAPGPQWAAASQVEPTPTDTSSGTVPRE